MVDLLEGIVEASWGQQERRCSQGCKKGRGGVGVSCFCK